MVEWHAYLMARSDGWSGLFSTAFKQSRNAMVLVDDRRVQMDVNGAYLKLLGYDRRALIGQPLRQFVAGPSQVSGEEWSAALAEGQFNGEADMICADGSTVGIQYGAATEVVTGRKLVLFVALSTSRWGGKFRRTPSADRDAGELSAREREVVRLISLGRSGPEISEELQIAHNTVRTHVSNSMLKMGARSRAHLVANALSSGVVLR
jgi:PAS domain S-box-containing protein